MSPPPVEQAAPCARPGSLPETRVRVAVPAGRWRQALAFCGPGSLVAVGYVDPGNWATDIAGGARHGYALLWVVALSSLMAMLLQALSARLGLAAGIDLARACRLYTPRPVGLALWLLAEGAIVACDLAEVIGAAIALQLLFGMPLPWGVALTVADVLLVLALQRHGMRPVEALVVALLATVGACFAVQLALAQPDLRTLAGGLVPAPSRLAADADMLYLAVGIVGATVMPHNLYLHSALVQTRRVSADCAARRRAIRWATLDSTLALTFAFVVNAAILVLAASVFHAHGRREVADIADAHALIAPLLGSSLAATLFALALLAAGQSSTLTGTLAGQVVMEGFLELRWPAWVRRLATRALAIGPALLVTALYGERGAGDLLVASQVVLSLQLPFAVVPLIALVRSRHVMGELAVGPCGTALACGIAALIVAMNVAMLAGLWSR